MTRTPQMSGSSSEVVLQVTLGKYMEEETSRRILPSSSSKEHETPISPVSTKDSDGSYTTSDTSSSSAEDETSFEGCSSNPAEDAATYGIHRYSMAADKSEYNEDSLEQVPTEEESLAYSIDDSIQAFLDAKEERQSILHKIQDFASAEDGIFLDETNSVESLDYARGQLESGALELNSDALPEGLFEMFRKGNVVTGSESTPGSSEPAQRLSVCEMDKKIVNKKKGLSDSSHKRIQRQQAALERINPDLFDVKREEGEKELDSYLPAHLQRQQQQPSPRVRRNQDLRVQELERKVEELQFSLSQAREECAMERQKVMQLQLANAALRKSLGVQQEQPDLHLFLYTSPEFFAKDEELDDNRPMLESDSPRKGRRRRFWSCRT